MDICKYKDSLGIPKVGVHKHYFGVAMFDVVGTIVIGLILSFTFKWNIIITIVILFILGIIAHRLFCVKTTVDKILFS
jgi:hypothetical protein